MFNLFSKVCIKTSPYFQIIYPIKKNRIDLEIKLAVIKIKKLIPIKPLDSVIILNGPGVKPPIKTYMNP